MKNYKKLDELPMREYMMYAFGASHAEDFELYTERFKAVFLSQPERLNPEDANNSVSDSPTS